MSSVEYRAPEPPLSPEARVKLKARILESMGRIIERYEAFYLSVDEMHTFVGSPLTNARYARFETWLGMLSEKKILISSALSLDQVHFAQDVSRVVLLYQALQDLSMGRSVATDIRNEYEERPLSADEFLLREEDLPLWNEFPSEEEVKTAFNFDSIWSDEYWQGRKLKDANDAAYTTKETLKDRKGFEPTDQDLLNVGYAVDDSDRRHAFLRAVEEVYVKERLQPAKIFEIGDIIDQKKKEAEARGKTVEDYLTTKELLEAFDEASVRPATLKELLAYAKTRWKPINDPNQSLTEEEMDQHANAPYICALGSVFSNTLGQRRVPYLRLDRDGRRLSIDHFSDNWYMSRRFLVFRKSFS